MNMDGETLRRIIADAVKAERDACAAIAVRVRSGYEHHGCAADATGDIQLNIACAEAALEIEGAINARGES